MEYLNVKEISYSYQNEPLLSKVSASFKAGHFYVVAGANGSAKSTFIKCLLGLIKPQAGTSFKSKTNINKQALKIAYLPQDATHFNKSFPSTIYELLSNHFKRETFYNKKLSLNQSTVIESFLEMFDLKEIQSKMIGQLSGGQKQKVLLAYTLVKDPDVYVLDEPTNALDEHSISILYDYLEQEVT
ncbi:MAG: metal ABC transporter ATP-binding protein, partial [Bacilli bacterium]